MFTLPLQWTVDLAAALLLFAVLGRQWILLPGLIMEAVPGLSIIPFWVLVAAGVAKLGTVRPNLRSMHGNPNKSEGFKEDNR